MTRQLSEGDRKALNKGVGKARSIANILAVQSAEMRAEAQTLIQQAASSFAKVGTSGCGQTATSRDRPRHTRP